MEILHSFRNKLFKNSELSSEWYESSAASLFFSLFIHCFLLFIFLGGWIHFKTSAIDSKKAIETPPQVVFDLTPPLPATRATVQTASEHPLEKAPQNTPFESHENTVAATELAPTGSVPLPSQEGHESDIIELKTAESSGRTLPATEHEGEKDVSDSSPGIPLPTPIPLASPITSPAANQPVMGRLSAKAKGEDSGSHPSIIHGNISNRGKSSVAAEATPIGRYKKTLADAISSHWYYSIDHKMELLSFGTATVFFYVNQEGKIEDLRIISNTSNQAFAECCLQSIMEAKLPSIPSEIAKTLDKGRLEIEYRFTIYPD